MSPVLIYLDKQILHGITEIYFEMRKK